MKFEFKNKDIAKLAQVLESKPKRLGTSVRFEIENKEQRRKLAVEIYSNIDIGNRKGKSYIRIYTNGTSATAFLYRICCQQNVGRDYLRWRVGWKAFGIDH